MDVRSLANSVTSKVNQNVPVSILLSTGYTIGDGRKQTPTYADPITGFAQKQALDGKDLKQLEGLNLQGTIQAMYFRGALSGVVRPDSKGGDIVLINGRTWLIVKVLESWSDYTKVAIVLQA